MIETKTKTIDGLIFTSTQLPPLKAYPLSTRVAGILLPAFTRFMSSGMEFGDADQFLAQDASKLIPILEPLLKVLGEKDNEDLPQKLLAGTSVQVPDETGAATLVSLATPEGINRAFQGRMLTMLKAMWFSIEVNFFDFFGGASKTSQIKASEAGAKATASA
jgi:hypothetical protein